MDAFKKLLARLTTSKALKILACIFPSLYLTIYVNLYMLDSFWLCLPIFGCFFAVCEILLRIASRLFKSAPQPETALLSIAVAVIVLAEDWGTFFPPGDAHSSLEHLLYGSGILSMIGFFCLCGSCALSGKKEEQRENGEKARKIPETAETEGRVNDIYISCSDYIQKLKRINIRASINRHLKKWIAPIIRCLKKWMEAINRCLKKWITKLKALLVTLLANVDRWLVVYAFLFSSMLVVGGKMSPGGNPYFQPMVFADFLWTAALFCVSLTACSILKAINGRYSMEMQTGGISKGWWLCAWLLLIILWSPYLLAYYPGTLSADSFTSLEQVKDLGLLYNHIPIAYTLLIALFVRIGWEIGDANFGVFLFSFIQMVTMAGVLSYSAYWIRKKVRYRTAAFGTLLFYGLNPIVALYSITMWKDVLFSAWIVLLCLFLFDMAGDGGRKLGEKKSLLWLSLLFILISFGRNNGVYVVFLCWIGLLLFYKSIRKKLLTTGGVILAIILIQGPGYKALGIEQSGFAESAGIPLQQICYTVVMDGPLEEKEQAFLENIIPIETIRENYSPISVDDIKFNKEFNKAFFEENKLEFVKLYLKLLPSHFQAYVEAYLLSTSGFWHIEPIYWITAEDIYENDMGIYNIDYMKKYLHFDWKKVVSGLVAFLRDGPLANIGQMVWLVFFYIVVCFSQKQSWKSILALPLIGCWLTLMIATPVNSQFRYVYYYHLMLPIVGIMFFVKKDTDEALKHQVVPEERR